MTSLLVANLLMRNMTLSAGLGKSWLVVCLILGLWGMPARSDGQTLEPIAAGRKPATEQAIIAELSRQLAAHAGIEIELAEPMPTAKIRAALERGDLAFYWEYTGTALAVFHRVLEPLAPSQQLAQLQELDISRGLVWLEPSQIDNRYVFYMRSDRAQGYGITNLSDLAASVREGWPITLAADAEFYARPDGLKPLQSLYDFRLSADAVSHIEGQSELITMLLNGTVDAIIADSTSPWARSDKVQPLIDDQGFFPPYILTPVIRADALQDAPELADLLGALATSLDSAAMSGLLAKALDDEKPLAALALEFLIAHQLLPPVADEDASGD